MSLSSNDWLRVIYSQSGDGEAIVIEERSAGGVDFLTFENTGMKDKAYNFEERLVHFAGEIILFCQTLSEDLVSGYFSDQIIRSASGAALNYGEAQGTTTCKDFIHKMTTVLKELRETKVSLKILDYIEYGNQQSRSELLSENDELSAISAKMILNKKKQLKTFKK